MYASHLCPQLSCPLTWEAIPQLLSVLVCAEGGKDRKSQTPISLLKVLCVPGVLNLGSFQSNRCCTGESAFCAKGQVLDLFSSWHARTHWHSSHL